MTDDNRPTNHLTADDLRNYRAGVLSAAEQHRVERLLLENPLYADALEGLEAAEQEKIDLNRVSGELRQRLQNRIPYQPKSRRMPLWVPAAAASVVLALGVSVYFYRQEKPDFVSPTELPASPITQHRKAVPAPDTIASLQAGPVLKKSVQTKRPIVAGKTGASTDSLHIPMDLLMANSAGLSENRIYERSSEPPLAPSLNSKKVVIGIDSVGNSAVSGRIVDVQNRPLPDVVVLLKKSLQKTVTDTAGRFTLKHLQANDSLLISHKGYETRTVPVRHSYTNDLKLAPDFKAMSELFSQHHQIPSPSPSFVKPAAAGTAPPMPPRNFQTYLGENRRMPPEAKQKGISGTVRVRFQVGPDGSVSQLSVVQSLGYGCDEEAIRLIQEGPRWQPALRNGKPFAGFTEQEIVF
ncbi:TonB family protein [Larkinella arboricola]